MALKGKKQDIVNTGSATALDWQISDKRPFAVSSQRKIARLSNGKLVAVFHKDYKISLAESLDDGVTWKTTINIFQKWATGTLKNSVSPALAADVKGSLHLVWQASGPGATSTALLWYSKSSDGIRWTQPKLLPPVDETAYHEYPVIAMMTGKGHGYIAFACNGGLHVLMSKDYGDTWSEPKAIPGLGGQPTEPSLVVAKDGSVYLAYINHLPGVTATDSVFCAALKSGAKNWEKFTVFAHSKEGAYQPCIATDGQGLPQIAFATDTGPTDHARRAIHLAWPPEKSWAKPWMDAMVDTFTDKNLLLKVMQEPTIAIEKTTGLRSVVYVATDESKLPGWQEWPKNLRCRTSSDGVTWSTPPDVLTQCKNGQFWPQAWPNLFWQRSGVGKGLLVLWEGKAENAGASEPWALRAFRSDNFQPQ